MVMDMCETCNAKGHAGPLPPVLTASQFLPFCLARSSEEIENYERKPVPRLVAWTRFHYPNGYGRSIIGAEYLRVDGVDWTIYDMYREWHNCFHRDFSGSWHPFFGTFFAAMAFCGGGDGLWWIPHGPERLGFPMDEFAGPRIAQVQRRVFNYATGPAHGVLPAVTLCVGGVEVDYSDTSRLTCEQKKEYGRQFAKRIFRYWMKPSTIREIREQQGVIHEDMGLTYWGKCFDEHDAYECGFEWFLDGYFNQGFFNIQSPEGLNMLQYAAWLGDYEAQREMIHAEKLLANEVVPDDATKCQGRTALQIMCEGTAPVSEQERVDAISTVQAYLKAMNPETICWVTAGGKTFAHDLPSKKLMTLVLRDAIYWLCENEHSSPLFQDWSGVLPNWVPITTRKEAWGYVFHHLINCPDSNGKGCLDIALAQTMGNRDTQGVYRVEMCGGVELIKHRHHGGHVNFRRDGRAWNEEQRRPRSRYIDANTNEPFEFGHLCWRLDHFQTDFNERPTPPRPTTMAELQQAQYCNPWSDRIQRRHTYVQVLYIMSRDGYASINEHQYEEGLGDEEMIGRLLDAARDEEEIHTELYSQYEVMARFFETRYPVKKEDLLHEGREDAILSGAIMGAPVTQTPYRNIAFGYDARCRGKEYSSSGGNWNLPAEQPRYDAGADRSRSAGGSQGKGKGHRAMSPEQRSFAGGSPRGPQQRRGASPSRRRSPPRRGGHSPTGHAHGYGSSSGSGGQGYTGLCWICNGPHMQRDCPKKNQRYQ